MSNLQAAVRAFATEAARPAELCEQVNTVLCGHIAEGRFISFFYCVADAEVGMLSYTNAGHFPPFVVRADGSVERLDLRRRGARRLPRRRLRGRVQSPSPLAIAWCSIPTESPRPGTTPTKSSARSG